MTTRESELLKMRDVMVILNLSRPKIYQLIEEGKLRCARPFEGGQRLFRADEVEKFKESLFSNEG